MRSIAIAATIVLALCATVAAQAQKKGPPAPTVESETFDVQAPVIPAGFVGDMKIKGRVDSITLVGTAQSYFTIDAQGNITVTAAGATAINALTAPTTYSLTVAATNPGGTGTGTATINAQPKPVNAPVVSSATFTITAPVSAGQIVGKMQATNAPTSWAITGSTP